MRLYTLEVASKIIFSLPRFLQNCVKVQPSPKKKSILVKFIDFAIYSALDRAKYGLSNALWYIDYMLTFKDIIAVFRDPPTQENLVS